MLAELGQDLFGEFQAVLMLLVFIRLLKIQNGEKNGEGKWNLLH